MKALSKMTVDEIIDELECIIRLLRDAELELAVLGQTNTSHGLASVRRRRLAIKAELHDRAEDQP